MLHAILKLVTANNKSLGTKGQFLLIKLKILSAVKWSVFSLEKPKYKFADKQKPHLPVLQKNLHKGRCIGESVRFIDDLLAYAESVLKSRRNSVCC